MAYRSGLRKGQAVRFALDGAQRDAKVTSFVVIDGHRFAVLTTEDGSRFTMSNDGSDVQEI